MTANTTAMVMVSASRTSGPRGLASACTCGIGAIVGVSITGVVIVGVSIAGASILGVSILGVSILGVVIEGSVHLGSVFALTFALALRIVADQEEPGPFRVTPGSFADLTLVGAAGALALVGVAGVPASIWATSASTAFAWIRGSDFRFAALAAA